MHLPRLTHPLGRACHHVSDHVSHHISHSICEDQATALLTPTRMAHPHSTQSFVVPVRDLDDGPKHLAGEITVEWLRTALENTEATPGERPGELDVELSKNGAEVLVRGRARVEVVVPCARTLAPITLSLTPEIFLLLRRAAPQPRASLASSESAAKASRSSGERAGGRRPRERGPHKHRPHDREKRPARHHGSGGGWAHTPVLDERDAAEDTYDGEQIILDSYVREFILLELPMFPVRQDLPSLPVDARGAAPGSGSEQESASPETSSVGPRGAPVAPIDPRLAPLVELKERLGQKKHPKE